MHYKCLIVDDEIELARMTAEYFRMFEVSTHYVTSAETCLDFFKDNTTDIVLLDINLSDGSGFEVCKTLREEYKIPILFISARQSDDDVLIALSIGGDDYIKKPYSLSVLLAKVKVILKRLELQNDPVYGNSNDQNGQVPGSGESNPDISESRLVMDPGTMSAVLDGRRIPLKAKEYALLNCLNQHADTIVKKEILFDEVWGDSFFSDSTLNVHIRKLREKLEKDPNEPDLIRTVWGTGYYLKLTDDDKKGNL